MEDSSIRIFLTAFFSLFRAYVKEYSFKSNKVLGIVSWQDDEDEQPFSWLIDFDEYTLLKIKLLCEFLIQHNFIQGDRIIISPSKLKTLLHNNGWDESEAEKIINALCLVKIRMLDDGEETDSFFVHF